MIPPCRTPFVVCLRQSAAAAKLPGVFAACGGRFGPIDLQARDGGWLGEEVVSELRERIGTRKACHIACCIPSVPPLSQEENLHPH